MNSSVKIQVFIMRGPNGFEVGEDLSCLRGERFDPNADKSIIWVDLVDHDGEALKPLAKYFGLHELAVEDCMTPGHFPKLEEFGDHIFMLVRALKPQCELEELWKNIQTELRGEVVQATQEELQEKFTRKLSMFLSERFVVTFRRRSLPWLEDYIRQFSQQLKAGQESSTDKIAHHVMDALVDRFGRGLDFFEKATDRLERLALQDPDAFHLPAMLYLKRELVWIRQIVRDERMVATRLAISTFPFIGKQQKRYFRDVEDHIDHIENTIVDEIESLSGLRDTHFAMNNVRLSDTMRILAVITTIAAPLNIIVGLYGMNFDFIPMLHHEFGFWSLLVVMLSLTIFMLLFFKKKRWI